MYIKRKTKYRCQVSKEKFRLGILIQESCCFYSKKNQIIKGIKIGCAQFSSFKKYASNDKSSPRKMHNTTVRYTNYQHWKAPIIRCLPASYTWGEVSHWFYFFRSKLSKKSVPQIRKTTIRNICWYCYQYFWWLGKRMASVVYFFSMIRATLKNDLH